MRDWASYSVEETDGRRTLVVTGPLHISTVGALDRELRAFEGKVDLTVLPFFPGDLWATLGGAAPEARPQP